MTRFVSFVAILFALSVGALRADVSGRVVVVEKGSRERPLSAGVLIYLDGGDGVAPVVDGTKRAAITSRDKTFEPRVTAVVVGESVTFPNVDDIMHNVFSLSKGNRFDLGLYKSGASKEFVFETPGLVRVYCNIHPQMSAFVQVRPNPYFAWVGPDGSFRIEGVPAGQYTLRSWHEEGESTQPIVVTENGAMGLVVTLDVSQFKKRPHLNKFGKPYKRKRGKY